MYELYHHGVLGMKWGVRRYQNKNGSLTLLGRRRSDRDKMRMLAASKSKEISDSDRVRFERNSKSIFRQAGSTLGRVAAGNAIYEALNKRGAYKVATPKQIAGHLIKVAGKTVGESAASIAQERALARSAMKRYDVSENGQIKRISSNPNSKLTKEDKIELGIAFTSLAAVSGVTLAGHLKGAKTYRDSVNAGRAYTNNLLSEKSSYIDGTYTAYKQRMSNKKPKTKNVSGKKPYVISKRNYRFV